MFGPHKEERPLERTDRRAFEDISLKIEPAAMTGTDQYPHLGVNGRVTSKVGTDIVQTIPAPIIPDQPYPLAKQKAVSILG